MCIILYLVCFQCTFTYLVQPKVKISFYFCTSFFQKHKFCYQHVKWDATVI